MSQVPIRKLFKNMAAQQLNIGPPLEVETNHKKSSSNADKRLSVERIYQKKTQLEHILLRPDSYIGSVEFVTQSMWVYDGEETGMVNREISFVPGLYKIFDEILVNAADNKQRDKNMDCIKIDIDPENNKITIWNNGKGIPVVEHKVEKMFVPSLIFGQLLTSSNYNDEEKKVTGGRNGYGAKLCNIFSKKFVVETSSKENKSSFKQMWQDNMTKTTDPKLSSSSSDDFTRITFYPDLAKFKMDVLDKDIVALMSRRAYDVAGSTRGVKVFLNGRKLPVKGFKDYIDQYIKGKEDDQGNPLKVVYEVVSDRWEVGVTQSDKGYQQISFVNSIATTKGGRHTDYVTDQILNKVADSVKKKNKGGVQVKPFQIKNHMWVFVNCLIENPTFDSQTKENMTLQMKSFGSKCPLSDKFFNQVLKCGIVECIMTWVKFKAQTQLNQKCHGTKRSKLKGIPKLEDANDAGTKNSIDCTLILTEGDSAKTLAVSGLGVIGRDKFGVFPLRGKMLNVREASHKQILENAEINNVIKIMGLQYKKKYESMDDLRTLRYGRLMIMTDQDQDGSHIKGLLINFIHHNWPSLLRLPFLEEFITPIVKATKGREERCFYSLPEFEEWKTETGNWNTWKIKYYKGLGTSTSKEAKEYFADMVRHRIKFKYQGTEDDSAIQLAFSKKMIEQRKEWLTNGMDERKRRRELGLPELYLYGKNTTAITYNDFVNKELILFSNMDNERSIPSLVDGLKPGQRKVIFTCLKRNDKREVKVAQLAGSVAEHSAYHHGEVSLMSTIINLAQNYVGSNNLNLLQPIGQFGTRLQGGKDSASPRYIFTMLSPLAKLIMNPLDEPLLRHLYDDNQRIEPEYYVPVLPMVLVNGAEGIGTGWSTKIPNYNPREIVANLRRMIAGDEPKAMMPWFKNFKGSIEPLDAQRFLVNGEVALLSNTKLEITELPIRTWTQAYKESVLEVMLHGTDKTPAAINDYKEYNTDSTIRFVVFMSEDKLAKAEEQGLHKMFKLQTTMGTSSMVLFDSNGCLRKYESPEEILREFFSLRLTFYERRKIYLVGMLKAEANKLSNQARFIVEKCDGIIVIENKRKLEMIKILVDKGYDSDPVKTWKNTTRKEQIESPEEEEPEDDDDLTASTGPDYEYLLGMPLWSLTKERKDDLLKKRDEKKAELDVLKAKSPSDLWEEDLTSFMQELDIVEAKEREDEQAGISGKAMKQGKLGGAVGKRPRKQLAMEETQPSPHAQRIVPKIDPDLKKKIKDPTKEGVKKRGPKAKVKDDDDVEPAPLADRIGSSPDKLEAGSLKKKSLKQSKLSFKNGAAKASPGKGSPKKGKKGKKKNPWSSASDQDSNAGSESDRNSDDSFKAAAAAVSREPTLPRRATAVQKKYTYDSDNESEDEGEAELVSNPLLSDNEGPMKIDDDDASNDGNDSPAIFEDDSPPPAAKKRAPAKSKKLKPKLSDSEEDDDKGLNGVGVTISSDSDDSFPSKPKRPAPPSKPAREEESNNNNNANNTSAESLFDSLLSSGGNNPAPPPPPPPPVSVAPPSLAADSKKRQMSDSGSGSGSGSDSDSSMEKIAPKKPSSKPPPAPKAAAPKRTKKAPQVKRPKKKGSDSDESDDDFSMPQPKKSAPARKKKDFDLDVSDDDMEGDAVRPSAGGGGGRARSARSKAPISYNVGDSSNNDDSDF